MAAWPNDQDLLAWIRSESVAPSSEEIVSDCFDAANELLRERIDTEMFNAVAAKAGVDVDDEQALAAWCPSYVRQAILIRAASILTRRDSANGTISFGEFATRVAKMDPDVDELMRPVVFSGIT